jgi:WD40 repeat protein
VDIEQILSSSDATKIDPIKTLVGHTSNVRAICWSDEDVNLLLTGSWDSTIRVWDCWTGECQVINHHAADVYAITSHPKRPFVFVSSSRDTTIRMWEIDGKYKAMRYLAVSKLSLKDLFYQDSSASSELAVLQGSGSRAAENLIEFLTSNEAPENKLVVQLLKYYVIYNFFCGSDGSLDIIESLIDAEIYRLEVNVSHLIDEVLRPSNLRQVVHDSTIISRARSEATRLESTKAGGRRGEMKGKVAEQLADAAKIYAQIGDFESYCNVMVELGEWTTAIAIAPKVSLEFWSSLASQYADVLNQSMSEKSIPFFLASGRVDEAISVYFDRKDFQSALVISKVHEDASGDNELMRSPPRVKQPNRSTSTDWLSATMDQTSAAEVIPTHKPSRLRSKATNLLVDSYLCRSQSMLAAASFAAAGDISSLMEVLNMNGDYDLAFVVSTLYNLPEDSSRLSVARMLADSGAIGIAIEMLEAYPNADVNIGQLLCRGTFDDAEAATWISKSKVKTHQWWIQNAREEESIGRDDKAVLSYILSWQFEKAGKHFAFLYNTKLTCCHFSFE